MPLKLKTCKQLLQMYNDIKLIAHDSLNTKLNDVAPPKYNVTQTFHFHQYISLKLTIVSHTILQLFTSGYTHVLISGISDQFQIEKDCYS